MASASDDLFLQSGHRDVVHPHEAVLVGRTSELTLIDQLLDRAVTGNGGAILIEGAAGLGKTRLIAECEARARARGLAVFDARAIVPERGVPFSTALQLFETAVAAAGTDSTLFDGAAALATPLFSGHYADAIETPFPLQHGLFWLAVNLTRSAPLLVCVDDAQWADEGSLGFLHYLARRVNDLPIAVVVTTRPGSAGQRPPLLDSMIETWSHDRLPLSELTTSEVASLVREWLPLADTSFCDACSEVTGGNPFYVREVLKTVGTRSPDPAAHSSPRLRDVAVASIGRASLSRLSRLGADPILLARALAVLGDGSTLRQVATLAELDQTRAAAAADALIAEDLIVVGTTTAFAHPLVAGLVYDEIPPVQAALAHRRAARLLAEDSVGVEVVAAHLLLATADADPWVTEMLRQAARSARAKGVPRSAAELLARAKAEPPAPADLADVLAELGSAESAAGLVDGVAHLRQALELRTDPRKREQARHELVRALAARGQQREAVEILESAIEEGEKPGPALLAEYLVNAAFETGLRQEAILRIHEMLRVSPSHTYSAERGLLATLAMRSGQEGAPALETVELADRAWSDGAILAEQGPDGPGWLMTFWALELAGEHHQALAVAAAARELARTTGSMEAVATASMFSAWTQSVLGNLLDAEADLYQVDIAEDLGWRRYLVAALSRKAVLQVWRGDLAAADATLARAVERDRGGGMETPWRLHAAGLLALARHDNAGALQLLTGAGDWLAENLDVKYTVLTWRTDAARAALALGDCDRARELIERDEALATRCGSAGHLGRVLRVRGLIAGGEEGAALLSAAAAHLKSAGEAHERAETLTDLGALLRRQGSKVAARPSLFDALDYSVAHGAHALAERARDELAASGVRGRPDRISGPTTLTSSERRVAGLAGAGLTNVQIAQALFVTPKTVEYHLRHVYQKLEISSRKQVAAALAGPPTDLTKRASLGSPPGDSR